MGVCFNPVDAPDIQRQKVWEGQILICVKSGHPLLEPFSGATAKWAKRVSKYPAVMPKAFQGIEVCIAHPIFETFGISPRVDCFFDSYDVAIEKMLRSESWGFLPGWVIDRSHGKIKSVRHPRGWNAPCDISAVYSRNRVLPIAMGNLLERIQQLSVH